MAIICTGSPYKVVVCCHATKMIGHDCSFLMRLRNFRMTLVYQEKEAATKDYNFNVMM